MIESSHKILLVGAGQLGSRHLQGLAQIDIPVSIAVIDPNRSSLKTAQERFVEIKENPNIKEIRFYTSIDKAPGSIDLAVIATGADVRAEVVTSLIADRTVRNIILEKFLFQKEADFARVGELLQKQQVNAVVNCPRRLYPIYRQLQNILSGEVSITFCVDGSNWGLGCNVIHFLDLFAFLTGNSSIKIDDKLLDKAVLESKRPGFVEFTGTLKGSNARGDRFEISSRIEPGTPLQVSIETTNQQIKIHEAGGKALFSNKVTGTEHQETFTMPYQSQLTGVVAREMLMNKDCGLTPYHESMQLHLPVLRSFIGHLNNVSNKQYDYCPIT